MRDDADVTHNRIQISINFENKETDEDLNFFHNTLMNIGEGMHNFFDGMLCKGKAETSGVAMHDTKENLDQEKEHDSETYHNPYLMEI